MIHALQAIRTVDSRQTGGPEELLLHMGAELRNTGRVRSTILLLRKPDPKGDPVKDFGNRARAAGLPVLPLQEIRWGARWLGGLPRRLAVDVIHMHGQRANYFVWLMRRLFPATWGRTPLVATVHGWVQDNAIRKVVTWLELATLRDCDMVITVSEQQRQVLLRRRFPPQTVTVIRPGIPYLDVERAGGAPGRLAARQRWGIPQDAFVTTAIGRLSTEKRFDLFLQVCAGLAGKLPHARFMLVGGGKQEAALKAQAAALGLPGRLVFTGLTRDMPDVYAASDLVMITSDTEGTPVVLLEAMTSSVPVVATSVGGIPEIVTNEKHALLVPAGDTAALLMSALRIHEGPELRARLVEEGRALAGQFTVARMARDVEQVYSALARRPPPP